MRYSITFALLLLLSDLSSRGQTLLVYFDVNKADIRPVDKAALDSLVAHIPVTGIGSIQLAGHADNSGEDDRNDSLSLQRARAVRDYLHGKGWPDSLFKGLDGYGSHRPLNDNGSPAQKSLNRRVEIVIIAPPAAKPPAAAATPTLRDVLRDSTHAVGKHITLNHVVFYPGRAIPISANALVQLIAVMKEHPTLRIEIQGYICCTSDGFDGMDEDTHSFDLSVHRAKYVYNFLAGNGIEKERMSYKGFGGSNKIYPEERDETEMMANRSVEIKIVRF